jgi:hypothetical protein
MEINSRVVGMGDGCRRPPWCAPPRPKDGYVRAPSFLVLVVYPQNLSLFVEIDCESTHGLKRKATPQRRMEGLRGLVVLGGVVGLLVVCVCRVSCELEA